MTPTTGTMALLEVFGSVPAVVPMELAVPPLSTNTNARMDTAVPNGDGGKSGSPTSYHSFHDIIISKKDTILYPSHILNSLQNTDNQITTVNKEHR
jgi:hypothetical protein